jgi:hypothetical protein
MIQHDGEGKVPGPVGLPLNHSCERSVLKETEPIWEQGRRHRTRSSLREQRRGKERGAGKDADLPYSILRGRTVAFSLGVTEWLRVCHFREPTCVALALGDPNQC